MSTDFFEQTGKMAIGSRLRMFADKITEESAKIYEMYKVDFKPKWFPVFFVLSEGKSKTITNIAKEIGHSHPSVSIIVKEMLAAGLVEENKDLLDGRRNLIELSLKGQKVAEEMLEQYADVSAAVEAISRKTQNDLWKAMNEWEVLLDEKSFVKRVEEEKKKRESKNVKIVDYSPEFREAFKNLNEEWISTFFKMEKKDYVSLENPEEYILDPGGYILVALYKGKPLGVCALIKMNDEQYDYELAKMAVSPKVQGKNLGWLLGKAIIERAQELGASKVYLESNTILKPVINLYRKLGFYEIKGHSTPYERCNIQMELVVKRGENKDV